MNGRNINMKSSRSVAIDELDLASQERVEDLVAGFHPEAKFRVKFLNNYQEQGKCLRDSLVFANYPET
jgi:hypothetical protein